MSVGVFTRRKRVTFVEKTTGEVGDGTAWPIQVTLDQLAEIMYRVRDAKFYSGEAIVSVGFDGPGAFDMRVFVSSADLSATLVESTYDNSAITARGYCAVEDDPTEPMVAYSSYFGGSYSASYPPYGTAKVKDIGDNERGIWATGDGADSFYYWKFPTGQWINYSVAGGASDPLGFRTGFSLSCAASSYYYFPSPIYGVWGDDSGGASPTGTFATSSYVNILPEVAWVDLNSSGNPFDPANQLWLKIEFTARWSGLATNTACISTLNYVAAFPMTAITGAKFTLRLAGSVDLSCQIYFNEAELNYYGYPYASATATDFVLEAVQWWPYAKVGGPVWNSTTGAKL